MKTVLGSILRRIEFAETKITCPTCKGSGLVKAWGHNSGFIECAKCAGTGKVNKK